jgi:hypothetical protein
LFQFDKENPKKEMIFLSTYVTIQVSVGKRHKNKQQKGVSYEWYFQSI